MMEELKEIFGSTRLPQARGIAQFEITAGSEFGSELLCRRVATRRQFEVSGPPCPDQVKDMVGKGEFGSLVHVHPVEFGRQVEAWRTTAKAHDKDLAKRSQEWAGLDDLGRPRAGGAASLAPERVRLDWMQATKAVRP